MSSSTCEEKPSFITFMGQCHSILQVHKFHVPSFLFNTTHLHKTITIIRVYTHTHTHTHIYIYIYIYIKGDSKRWTQLNSKRRLNTRQTFGCGIPSSLLALLVDLLRLLSNLSLIPLIFSSDTRGRPELCLYTYSQICSNYLFQRQMPFLVGG